jgi:hypothetical protein
MSIFGSGKDRSPEPVQVAWASNQAEAEMIQGILESEGIPSLVQRAKGFDVADFLAAGPRYVLVPASAEERARKLLEPPEGEALPGE